MLELKNVIIRIMISTVLIALLGGKIFAQDGNVKGVLTEEQDGQILGLPFANVFIEGTTYGGITDFDGNFNFTAPIGKCVLVASFMGYKQYTNEIEIIADVESNYSILMVMDGLAIESVSVVAKVNRESEMALIMEQKNASVAIEAIGARELSAKGVSDAASAVGKVTGITIHADNGTLNVRGLGDRYNTTTLNRLPLPSNNPEVKNIDLSLFTTDVISHINVEKNYASNLNGDFGGANIDIVSKRLNGDSFVSVGVKLSQNSSVFGVQDFNRIDGPGNTGFHSENIPNVDQIRSSIAYGFSNSWDAASDNVLMDLGFGVSAGKSFSTKKGELNTFITLSFDNEKQYTERLEKIVSATGVALTDVSGEEFQYSTQSNAMLNLNYSVENSEIYFNSMLLNSSEESLVSLSGNIRDVGEDAFRMRSEFNRNMVLVNQLLGEHSLKKDYTLNWGLAYNNVWNTVPDRRQNQYTTYNADDNTGEFDTEPAGANFRYFHEFTDNEFAANITAHKKFFTSDSEMYKHKLSFGFSGRYKFRQFNNYQFNHDINENIVVNVNEVDAYLNEANYINEAFDIIIVEPRDENGEAIDGEEYSGLVSNNGLFAMWEWNINSRLLLVAGLRGEFVYQEITTRANQITGRGTNVETVTFKDIKVLPSLSLKYALRENQNLRFATSKTYTLPQMQEMPLMSFSGISDEKFGNPYLQPSEVYNADLKWELFPKAGLLSFTAFGKYIIDPINQTTLAGTMNSYFVANTGDWAYAYGFEVDARKDFQIADSRKIFAAGNMSLMQSEMELDGEKIREETDNYLNANFNDDRSTLQGAAPFLANVSLGYSQEWKGKNSVSAVVVYNYTSDRLYAIGQTQRGNEYERAISTLDFVLKSKFGNTGIEFKAKNILNPEYVREQENRVEENTDHIISKYQRGINLSLSLVHKF